MTNVSNVFEILVKVITLRLRILKKVKPLGELDPWSLTRLKAVRPSAPRGIVCFLHNNLPCHVLPNIKSAYSQQQQKIYI